jgi:hypothetical protein
MLDEIINYVQSLQRQVEVITRTPHLTIVPENLCNLCELRIY